MFSCELGSAQLAHYTSRLSTNLCCYKYFVVWYSEFFFVLLIRLTHRFQVSFSLCLNIIFPFFHIVIKATMAVVQLKFPGIFFEANGYGHEHLLVCGTPTGTVFHSRPRGMFEQFESIALDNSARSSNLKKFIEKNYR